MHPLQNAIKLQSFFKCRQFEQEKVQSASEQGQEPQNTCIHTYAEMYFELIAQRKILSL